MKRFIERTPDFSTIAVSVIQRTLSPFHAALL
jgi:hypothetical protein